MSGKFTVGLDEIWPRWFALAVADNRIRTESGGPRRPIRCAYVKTADGEIIARDGDRIEMDDDGELTVSAGAKWRFHF